MSIQNQFSKHANEYSNNNIIQQIVSKALVREIKSKPKRILELGCGSGQVYNQINWEIEYYKAIDFSQSMCDIHPKDNIINIYCFDFDSEEFWQNIKNEKYDIVLSSSAIQWSKNLPKLLKRLASITKELNVVLFTSNTFKTIQKITNTKSPILTSDEIKKSFKIYSNTKFETISYDLEFDNKKKMFKYIKDSGVSGDSNLSFKNAKKLYNEYSLNYLEFEVIFIKCVF
jgi:malonyl-CoA O-methyltransferase